MASNIEAKTFEIPASRAFVGFSASVLIQICSRERSGILGHRCYERGGNVRVLDADRRISAEAPDPAVAALQFG